MKQLASLLVLSAVLLGLSGCGGPNRAALAEQTVKTYWTDIGNAKIAQAYHMMTSGNQASRSLTDYSQDMFGFLEGTAGISVTVGKATVTGDDAVVPVHLHSPKAVGNFNAYQHLFWENGQWKISDENGGLSKTK